MGGKVDQAANWVNEEVIQPVGNFVGETVEAIANDPLPFIATIALTAVGVPPSSCICCRYRSQRWKYGRYCYCGSSDLCWR
jgi:hypothetical protein